MFFEPKNFLNFAKSLFKKVKDEEQAKLRTIIGRAYYSAFLFCRHKLEEKYPHIKDIETGEIHKIVREKLVDENRAHEKSMLVTIREMRDDADYDLEQFFAKRDAGKAIEQSNRIFKNLKNVRFT